VRNEVSPGNARISTYHDHRMAMCFATLGLALPGLKIEDPSCVRTFRPSQHVFFFRFLLLDVDPSTGRHRLKWSSFYKARFFSLKDKLDVSKYLH
jgi:hypothetical protein